MKAFFLVKIAKMILTNMSPDLKNYVKQTVLDLEKKAQATKSPWDDLAIELIKMILNIE